jgi:hypothetical protein
MVQHDVQNQIKRLKPNYINVKINEKKTRKIKDAFVAKEL